MSKQLYWYIRLKNTNEPESKYYGNLVIAKCERSAKFYSMNGLCPNWEVDRIKQVSEKTYNRLEALRKLRKQREHREWKANGGEQKLKKSLRNLISIGSMFGSVCETPYSMSMGKKDREVAKEMFKYAFSKDDEEE